MIDLDNPWAVEMWRKIVERNKASEEEYKKVKIATKNKDESR